MIKIRKADRLVIPAAVLLTALTSFSCSRKSRYYAEIKEQRIYLEIAADPASRSLGLMFRDSLKKNNGMLFIFPREEVVDFWMENTFIPLDIAFIDSSGTIVKTASMRPRDRTPVSSGSEVKYALEVNRGFFIENSIGPGDTVYFSGSVKEIEPR